jgi:hypothetical protein
MSHQRLTRGLVGASALFLVCAPVLADSVIGNWENTPDGWIDWGTQATIDTSGPKYAYVTGPGVTNGTTALQITQAGFNQNLSIKLQQDYTPANDLRDDFFEYTQFAISFTVPANASAGWAELYALSINAQNYGFINQAPTPKLQFGWGPTGNTNAQTATLTWDYSTLFDNNPGTGGGTGEVAAPSPGWLEFILATNSSDAAHGTFIMDNARLTSPRLSVDINGGSSPGTGHPKQRGFRGWNNLPTSGQNGDGAQNSYGTSTATTTFNTSIVTSGTVQANLKSRDVINAAGTPQYDNSGGAKLNSFDMSIAGRELNDNGTSFTPTRDAVYRDYVVAETGVSSNGTNHRMEIELTGLDANTPYKLKFYAYDNANTRNVAVFTDVTAQPLIFMPNANSGTGSFTPGDGTGGTQYAPTGQYIDGLAAPSFPAANEFRMIELYATSDGTGKLTFAETTVTGLSGATQVLPVLNGFEIEKDQRSWSGTGSNWNDSSNWSGAAIPNAKGQVANFGNTTVSSITVDQPTTIARLNFSGSALNITGANTLSLDDTSINSTQSFNITGRTEINLTATSANQTISAPLQLKKDTQVWVASAGTTLTASNLQPAQVVLSKVGAGKLAVNNVRTNTLRVQEGTVQVLTNGGDSGVSYVNTLTIGATAALDLNDNDLVVANGSYSTLQASVFEGYRGGPDTTATGIVSSTSQNVHGGTTILALFDNSLAGFSDFPFGSGHTIGASAIVGKYTYIGDTNMDGQVTPQDYTATDSNLGTSVDPAISWFYGDTNFDGNIDPTDYAGIDGALGLGQGNPLAAQGAAAVPEPGLMGLAAAALAGFVSARRRRT